MVLIPAESCPFGTLLEDEKRALRTSPLPTSRRGVFVLDGRRIAMLTETEGRRRIWTEREPGTGTAAVHGPTAGRRQQAHHALTTPLVQTATYTFDGTADLRAYMEAKMWAPPERGEYGRYGNPTVREVEKRLAALDQGDDALLYPTGMAAITNVLLAILSAGSHVV